MDVTDYSDICTVDVAHGMMNAAWGVDSDTICATVEYDIADTLESSVRVHEVGRLRPTAVSYTHLTLPTNREV
mgnify:CR=1 FL=1